MSHGDKYSGLDKLSAFGSLINAMDGGGDRGRSFPQSDAEDASHGLRFIPGEVTLARRRGERVEFVQRCHNYCCWYWQFSDGSRTYYWERWNYESIAHHNGHEFDGEFMGDAGACPSCGNTHTSGGHIKKP